jgi:adenylylsulfate kinase-like enzyme
MMIVITGPIASGKSTVARALARMLGRGGVRAAVIDLDLVYDMLSTGESTSDDANWTLARRGAATLANRFREDGVAVVIAEGSYNRPADRAAFVGLLHADGDPVYVTLQVSFDEALRRAQGDPTRGVSRDPLVLGPYFTAISQVLASVPATDIIIDTERMTPSSVAAEIASHVLPASR